MKRSLPFLSMIGVVTVFACRGAALSDPMVLSPEQLTHLVDSLMPSVATAAKMQFTGTPRSQIRTVSELQRFLIDKLRKELPPERANGLSSAYRLLGMIPDTLNLAALFEAIYKEQIAGYYDPDSTALYFIARGERTQVRFLLAHEMTHALQHQHLNLDSIMKLKDDGDRASAAQSILEGHAQLVAMLVLFPGQGILDDESFLKNAAAASQPDPKTMPALASAPLVIREGLLTPYLKGTEFVRWFRNEYPDEQPFGPRMPVSTEQILHPLRYAHGDVPLNVRFVEGSEAVLHEDTFGEFEITILRSVLAGIDQVPTEVALEWGGDRYRVYDSPDGPALVWMTVWDNAGGAQRFHEQIGRQLIAAKRTGYRTTVEDVKFPGHHAVRVVIAPEQWSRWGKLPVAELRWP